MTAGLAAELVWDGDSIVRIPEQMGRPRDDQMQGTAAEQVSEIAGRVCYDSLGKGRASFSVTDPNTGIVTEGYHDHILGAGHGSVIEHPHFTVVLDFNQHNNNTMIAASRLLRFEQSCINRPGVLVLPESSYRARLTVNLRAVVEWDTWTKRFYGPDFRSKTAEAVGRMLRRHGSILAPHIVKYEGPNDLDERNPEYLTSGIVVPESEHEKWVTMFMSGSRGFSHELVRHGDFTAISQRSTRFVDEAESIWIEHPLIGAFRAAIWPDNPGTRLEGNLEGSARGAYSRTVKTLETWLLERGVEKFNARKQARGAARGYLGNALYTELIFSASVHQWKLMLGQRCCGPADAEIREVFSLALPKLQACRYGSCFSNYSLIPSPDGIGQVGVLAV